MIFCVFSFIAAAFQQRKKRNRKNDKIKRSKTKKKKKKKLKKKKIRLCNLLNKGTKKKLSRTNKFDFYKKSDILKIIRQKNVYAIFPWRICTFPKEKKWYFLFYFCFCNALLKDCRGHRTARTKPEFN